MDGDYEHLVRLCWEGKLYEVEALLEEWVDPNPPPHIRKSALRVALGEGFHSLVVLLLRKRARVGSREMFDVAWAGNVEYMGLLLDHGGKLDDAHAIESACERGAGPMIDLLESRGVDLVTGSPLAAALKTGNKSIIGRWKRLLDKYPDLAAQGAEALFHFCEKGSERGVALMLWAGADPRMPILEEGEEYDPDWQRTAMGEAAYRGNLKMLRQFRVDPGIDDVGDLLSRTGSGNHHETVDYLLEIATPAQREDGLGRMLSSAISRVDWKSDQRLGWGAGRSDAEPDVQMIEKLAHLGAKLNAGEEASRLRSALRRADPRQALRIIRALAGGPIADIDELRRVVKTKTILARLEDITLSREDRELLALKPSKRASRGQTRPMLEHSTARKPWWPGQTFWQRRSFGP